jgi:hypothetical protein
VTAHELVCAVIDPSSARVNDPNSCGIVCVLPGDTQNGSRKSGKHKRAGLVAAPDAGEFESMVCQMQQVTSDAINALCPPLARQHGGTGRVQDNLPFQKDQAPHESTSRASLLASQAFVRG